MPRAVSDISGLQNIRTMHSAGKRSMPRVASSAYLDLYMLNKEKERFIKENERLCMRSEAIRKRLEEIDLEMNRLQEVPQGGIKATGNVSSSGGIFTQKDGVKKDWKKMPLNY